MCRRDEGHFTCSKPSLDALTSLERLNKNYKSIEQAVEDLFKDSEGVRMFRVRIRRHDPADELWDVPDNKTDDLELNSQPAGESLIIFWLRVCDSPKIVVYPQGQGDRVCDGSPLGL